MDPVRNPYAPGAGSPPPELAGRSEVIQNAEVSLGRIALGRAAQSPILVGLRGGSGKRFYWLKSGKSQKKKAS